MATLHLICGPPGAGKTTLARRIALSGAARLAPDDWMDASGIPFRDATSRDLMEGVQWQIAVHLLGEGRDVIIEWGTWARDERLAIVDGVHGIGSKVSAYFLTPDVDELLRRVAVRNATEVDAHRMSPDEVMEAAAAFQNPEPDEISRYDEFRSGTGAD